MTIRSDSISLKSLIPYCLFGALVYGLVNFPVIYAYINHAMLIEYSAFQSICLSLTHSFCLFLSFLLIFRLMLHREIYGLASAFLLASFFWFISSMLFGHSLALIHPGYMSFLHGVLLFLLLNVIDLAFIFLGLLIYFSIDKLMKRLYPLKTEPAEPKAK